MSTDNDSTTPNPLLGFKSAGHPYRVLIVDDSLFVVKQLSHILGSEGFEIAGTANDGAAGVAKFKELHPNVDLVTMDITMPGMDGISALQKIMEIDRQAVVIMISALGRDDLIKTALLAGAKNFFVKPLDRTQVVERITSTLKQGGMASLLWTMG